MKWPTVQLPAVGAPGWLRDRLSSNLLVAVGVGWLLVFFAAPVFVLLLESLNRGDGGLFDLYRDALTGVYLQTLVRTLAFALVSTIICLLLGYGIAYYVTFKATHELLLLGMVLLPLWIAIIIRYFGVQLFFLQSGPVVQLFGTDFGLVFSKPGVIIGLTSALLPFAVLPIYNSLRSIDDAYVDAAEVMGARPLDTFRTVVLPLSRSGVVVSGLFVYIMSAGSFLAPAILGGSGDFMMANIIESTFTYNVEFAAAIAVLFTGVLLVLIGLLNWRANLTEVLESI